MSNVLVLDACALIAYFNDEPGAEEMQKLLEKAWQGEVALYVSSLNVYELYCDCLRRSGSGKASELLEDVYSLPIEVVETFGKELLRTAANFKVNFNVSVADSIALGLAKLKGASLVTTDHHEFDPIEKAGKMRFYWLR